MGGMGAVFEATHRMLDRRVALKVMLGDDRNGIDLRDRFLREGAALVRVKHPNVVTVYDAGIVDGMPYLAMELLDGLGLDRIIEREGKLSAARAIGLLAPIAEGLSAVHAAGLVHRDVKSENLFVTLDGAGREVVKLIDFGIAKEASRTGVRNTVIGTPHYMPPEQLFGGDLLDGRADQYSLSVVLYEALTGSLPYDGNSVLDLAMNVERGGAPAPSERNPTIPALLDAVVLRGLARDVSDRFASMDAFHEALVASVPFGASTLVGSPAGRAITFDISDEIERARDFPTVIEPLAPTLPPPLQAHETTVRSESLPPVEGERRGLVLPLALGLAAVVAVVLGLSLARFGTVRSEPRQAAQIPMVQPVILPAVAGPDVRGSTEPQAGLAPAATAPEVMGTTEATAADPHEPSTPARRARRAPTSSPTATTTSPTEGPSIRLQR